MALHHSASTDAGRKSDRSTRDGPIAALHDVLPRKPDLVREKRIQTRVTGRSGGGMVRPIVGREAGTEVIEGVGRLPDREYPL